MSDYKQVLHDFIKILGRRGINNNIMGTINKLYKMIMTGPKIIMLINLVKINFKIILFDF